MLNQHHLHKTYHVAGLHCDPCGAMRWTVYGCSQVECSVLAISKSKHVGVPLNIFMYFNKINMLD